MENVPVVRRANHRGPKFFHVLGDDLIEIGLFIALSVLIWIICFSGIPLQGNRNIVAAIYSLGGDLGLHILVTSVTTAILSIRLKYGMRLDSLCDYLAIVARPKATFSLFSRSRFIAVVSLIIMNHLAEQAVNYGIPSSPSLIPTGFERKDLTLAPLGGGYLLSGDPGNEEGSPRFQFFATGLSVLATGPNENNTAFFTQNENELLLYHLPTDLFKGELDNAVTDKFYTLGYVGELSLERPQPLQYCATTSSNSLETSCDGEIPEKGVRFEFNVTNVVQNDNTDHIQYKVSFLNKDPNIFGPEWMYSITLRRSIVSLSCEKKAGQIACGHVKDERREIPGMHWIEAESHANDLQATMASCFVNLLSFNVRARRIEQRFLAGKLITAMHIRHAADDSFTGGLATSVVKNLGLQVNISNGILTYRGPFWIRVLVLTISVLASLGFVAKLVSPPTISSSLVSIISSLGKVVTKHRAPCASEKWRALRGLYEDYDRSLKVYSGLTAGHDRKLLSGKSIKLTKWAGPGPERGSSAADQELLHHLAHFEVSTEENVVKISDILPKEMETIVYGKSSDPCNRLSGPADQKKYLQRDYETSGGSELDALSTSVSNCIRRRSPGPFR